MDPLTRIQQEAELRRLTRAKAVHRASAPSISADIVSVYRQSVKRTKKLGGIGEVWFYRRALSAEELSRIQRGGAREALERGAGDR